MTRETSSGNTDEWYERDFSPVGVNLRDGSHYRMVQSEAARLVELYDVSRADIYGMMLEYAVMDPEDRPETFEVYVEYRVEEIGE